MSEDEFDADDLREMMDDAYSNGEGETQYAAKYLLKALRASFVLTKRV